MQPNFDISTCEQVQVMSSAEVKAFRQSLGMTQAEFAKFVGAPVGTIASWEYGKTLSALANLRVRTLEAKLGKKLIANRNEREGLVRQAAALI